MDDAAELTVARRRLNALVTARGDDPDPGGWAVLAQTVAGGAYPTAAASVFLVTACELGGDDEEGAAVSIGGAGGGPFPAANVGTALPPPGTYVVVTLVGNRWVFRYDG